LGSLDTFGAFSFLETKSLLSSANTWSLQLIVDAVTSRIEAGKAAGSLREGTFMQESLPVVTLGAVGILGSKLMSFSSLSSEEDKYTASGETFLKAEEAETLIEERLAMQRV